MSTGPKCTNLIGQDHVEADGESNKEQEEDNEELHECREDMSEHDDVDAKPRQLSYDQNELHPGQEDCNGTRLPLPGLQYNSYSASDTYNHRHW